MKKNLRLFLLMLLISTSGLMVACKDDDMESITLKRSGNLRVVVKNGDAPVANTQVRFYNADTGNELDIVSTDEQGIVDFGKLNEGNYSISFEVSDPYSFIEQEFQVVSGENKEYSVQVSDYVGNLNLFLKDNYWNNIIKEDLNIGIAIVPDNDDFKKVFTNEEIIALATDSKYFGTDGKILFENIPTGDYRIYQILADTIVESRGTTWINRLDDRFVNIVVDINSERLFNKQWAVSGAINYNTSETVEGFPMESMIFSRQDDMFTMNLENGIMVKGEVGYYGGTSLDLYIDYTNNDDISVSFSEYSYRLDESGRMILKFNYFRIYDELTGTYIYNESNIEVVLE